MRRGEFILFKNIYRSRYVHKHLTKYYPSIQNKETEIKRNIGVYRRHRRGVKRKGLLGIPWRG